MSRILTIRTKEQLLVYKFSGSALEQSDSPLDPTARFPISCYPRHAAVSLDLTQAAYTTANELVSIDQNGKELWRIDFCAPEKYFMTYTATCEFSLDGKIMWLYRPDCAMKDLQSDQLLAINAVTGATLSQVELGSQGHNACHYAHPDGKRMLLNVGEGQDGCRLYSAHLQDGIIHLTEHVWDCHQFIDISPDGSQCLTVNEHCTNLSIHSYPGGDIIAKVSLDMFGLNDDFCSIDHYPGGYLDFETAVVNIRGESEEPTGADPSEWNQLYFVDTHVGKVIGPLNARSLFAENLFLPGDGSWLLENADGRWQRHTHSRSQCQPYQS